MTSLFCRHNRFTADCPICSKGTLLDPDRPRSQRRGTAAVNARRSGAGAERRPASATGGGEFRGPYAAAGPYERDGERYEVRLERVPGGLRLAEWSAGRLLPRAPILPAGDLAGLIEDTAAAGALAEAERDELLDALTAGDGGGEGAAVHGASGGRSGELREELRVERLGDRRVRVARWLLRPGTGWEMLDAPPMLPARRYAEALRDAAKSGVLG